MTNAFAPAYEVEEMYVDVYELMPLGEYDDGDLDDEVSSQYVLTPLHDVGAGLALEEMGTMPRSTYQAYIDWWSDNESCSHTSDDY